MKKLLVKGVTTLTVASLLLLSTPNDNKAFAMTGFSSSPAMSTFSNTMNSALTTNSSSDNFAMSSLMEQMQNNILNNNTTSDKKKEEEEKKKENANKVSAVGYLSEIDEKFFIGDGEGKVQIISDKGDILAILPVLVDTDMLIEVQGEYNKEKKIVKADVLNLTKKPSAYLSSLIEEALDEYKATQPTSGRGYVVEKDGEYVLKIKKDYYSIETELEDITTILPIIEAEGDYTLVEVIGVLDAEEKKFTKVTKLNFLEKVDDKFLEKINEALLAIKDGKEVDASGFIRKSDGKFYIEVLGGKYEILLSDLYKDVQGIVPIVANKEVAVTMKGILDLESKTLEGTKIDIASQPSPNLLEKINEVLEEHAEGDANVVGAVNEISGDLYLTVKDKHYKISVKEDKPEILTFLNVVKGTDEKIKATGLISNKNLTINIGAITLVGVGSEETRLALATNLKEYIKMPESGSEISARGVIVEKGGKYYQVISFSDYLIKTSRQDLTDALPILAEEGLLITTDGVIDNELKLMTINKITINEKPSDEAMKKLNDVAVKNGGKNDPTVSGNNTSGSNTTNNNTNNNQNTSTGSIWDKLGGSSNNSMFGGGFGDLLKNFGSASLFQSMMGGSNGGTTDGEGSNNELGGLFGQLGAGNSAFGNFGSLFSQLGGSSSLFNSLLGNSNTSGMPNLSVDQIKDQMNNVSSGSTNNTSEGNSDGSITSGFSSDGEE